MTTREAIYKTALEHIRDGHNMICPECGWTGDSPYEQYDSQSGGAGGGLIARLCPICRGDIEDGPDEIAAYALAQAEKVES